MSEIQTVLCISMICYLVGLGCKMSASIKDEFIPVIVGICGGILGAAGLYIIPDFPAGDVLNAIAVGIASGLASTGTHQIYKQLSKIGEDEE